MDNPKVHLTPSNAGRGKSTAFQVLPFVSYFRQHATADNVRLEDVDATTCDSVVLVIAPLNAIMEQQTEFLRARQIAAIHVVPSTAASEFADIARGAYTHLFLSPETIMGATDRLRRAWRTAFADLGDKLVAVVVDEAHLQVSWGKDFRPVYAELGQLRAWTAAPVLLMSATITQIDFTTLLRLWSLTPSTVRLVREPCMRQNIHYSAVLRAGSLLERQMATLSRVYTMLVRDESCRVVVYCRKIEETSILAERLSDRMHDLAVHREGGHAGSWKACTVQAFHKEISDAAKQFLIAELAAASSHIRVVFATSALGCGADIRISDVVHNGPPRTISELVQESGRAGRDGTEARSVLLWSPTELAHCDADVREYCQSSDCKRKIMRAAFSEITDAADATPTECCDVCDNLREHDVMDVASDDDSTDETGVVECGISVDDADTWTWWTKARAALAQYTQQQPLGMFASGAMCTGLTPDVMFAICVSHRLDIHTPDDLRQWGVRCEHVDSVFRILSDVRLSL